MSRSIHRPTLPTRSGHRRSSGFSLIELMVTVAVLAILAAMAFPSFLGMVNSNRLTSQANELVGAIQLTRMEAVRRNARVTFCGTNDGATCLAAAAPWTDGWLIVLDSDNSILRSGQANEPIELTSTAASITFRGDGLARAAGGGLLDNTITVCIPNESMDTNRRLVQLSGGSRLSTENEVGDGECP